MGFYVARNARWKRIDGSCWKRPSFDYLEGQGDAASISSSITNSFFFFFFIPALGHRSLILYGSAMNLIGGCVTSLRCSVIDRRAERAKRRQREKKESALALVEFERWDFWHLREEYVCGFIGWKEKGVGGVPPVAAVLVLFFIATWLPRTTATTPLEILLSPLCVSWQEGKNIKSFFMEKEDPAHSFRKKKAIHPLFPQHI